MNYDWRKEVELELYVEEKLIKRFSSHNEQLTDCEKYHNIIISNGGYVYKPNSPIVKEWMIELHKRLDHFMDDLIKNPGDEFGSGNYPIPWAYLAGYLMTPLILKYHDKIIPLDVELYSSKNYR